jgi:hypothetical protein
LRIEPQLYSLYAGLLHKPSGPFDTDRLGLNEVDALLNGLAVRNEFGSRAAVDTALATLRAEQAAACAAHPGLRWRAAYMQVSDEFEDPLVAELTGLGRADPVEDAACLMHGLEPLGPDLFPGKTSDLQLVTHEAVREAAGWLSRIGPQRFGWMAEQYSNWQRVYLEAASLGEAIVIG